MESSTEHDHVDNAPTSASTPTAPLMPAVPTYGPCTLRNIEPGKKYMWCACGLSKKQPWCDGSHKGTSFKPLVWTAPEKPQTLYQLCACKYTKAPPFCDATHTNLPMEVLDRQDHCQQPHDGTRRLCEGCGWVPEW
eukprot:Opistho-2@40141